MLYITAILSFLCIWLFIGALFSIVFNKDKPIEKIKHFNRDDNILEKYENNKKSPGLLKLLSNLVPNVVVNLKWTKRIRTELIKADISITVQELIIINLILSLANAFLLHVITGNLMFSILMSLLAWKIPKMFITYKKRERVKQFDSQLSEGIIIMSNSLKAGCSFLQSLSIVAEETKEPLSKEFKKLLKEMSLGISEENALMNLSYRMESEDLKLIINVILIQKDIGGNLAGVLDNISETIRERQKIKNELKTLTAQGRLSGIVVMLLPVFLCLTFFVLNQEYMLLLFTTPIGIAMIAAGIISEIFGFFMIKKIVNIEM